MKHGGKQSGFTLLETLIGLGILTIISSALYSAYGNVLQIVQSAQYNSAALNIIESQIETVRNMRYEDVGTIGGVPAGKLLQTNTVTLGGTEFALHTYVRNIDDPFDGILGGAPNDTAPADYKLVEFQITCDTCTRYNIITMATYVGPKNLESSSKNGNLFVRVFNASGMAVPGATVRVTNTSVTPNIDLTDITNADGLLQLVDIATSSAGYHITVSKSGYTSDQSYPPGSPPNPLKPDATVATQQLTISSFSIDLTSTLTLKARNQYCQAIAGMDFLLTGTKLLGTSPDTPKYSVAQLTNGAGLVNLTALEWDSYALQPTDTALDIAGKNASLSFTVNPGQTQSMTILVASRSSSALLVSVTDASGVPLDDATILLTKAGFSASAVTGRSLNTQTNWFGSAYDSKSALADTDSAPGTLTLSQVAGAYATASEEWLISKTYDMATTSATFFDVSFNPASQPLGTTLRLQVAANNDDTTWNWVDLDGTNVPASLSGNRYIRYKVFLQTTNPAVAPSLNDIAMAFGSGCLATGQSYLNGLTNDTYTLTVTKTGFQPYSSPITISSLWQQTAIILQP